MTPSNDVTSSLEGMVLEGRYEIEAELGRGAMGIVYRARHVLIDRLVAIKVLHHNAIRSPDQLERFRREAHVTAKFSHPNIVPVIDLLDLPDGRSAMVLEFARGVSMHTLVGTPMDPARAILLISQMCDGLIQAHRFGLVHRDLKPENVIVERDAFGHETPRIIDFGISIFHDEMRADAPREKRLTDENLVLGTPAYMSPEQAMGRPVSAQSDQFSLGIMLYELLAGDLPFDGDAMEMAASNMREPLPPISKRNPAVRSIPALEAIVVRMTAKKPDARYPDMRAVFDALRGLRVRASRSRESIPPIPRK